MTLLALGSLPDRMLLEDAEDLAIILEATGRTIPRWRWCDEYVESTNEDWAEAYF